MDNLFSTLVGGVAFTFKGMLFWLSLCRHVSLSVCLEFPWKRSKILSCNRVNRLKNSPIHCWFWSISLRPRRRECRVFQGFGMAVEDKMEMKSIKITMNTTAVLLYQEKYRPQHLHAFSNTVSLPNVSSSRSTYSVKW
jgi:hypothetical protein